MSLIRGLVFGCLTATALIFTPAAQADHWQKSSDGYWYYWSDNDQRWFYQDGKKWQVLQNGQWVDSQGPAMQSSGYSQPGYYQSYYSDPDMYYSDGNYGGYNRGYGGYGGYYGVPGIYFGWGNNGWGNRGWDGRGWSGGGRGWGGGGGGGGGRGRR